MAKQAKFKLEEPLVHFDELEYLRSSINRHHRLASVLAIALLVVLSGTHGPTVIRLRAVARTALKKKCVPLPLSHSTEKAFFVAC